MIFRSMLFVPGDSERKLAKGKSSPADALILDLEDSVAPDRTAIARDMVRAYLRLAAGPQPPAALGPHQPARDARRRCPTWRPWSAGAPDGILLPKPDSAADIVLLDNYLTALEVRDGIAPNSIRIIPVATETAKAVFALGTYAGMQQAARGHDMGGGRPCGRTWRQHQQERRRWLRAYLRVRTLTVPRGRRCRRCAADRHAFMSISATRPGSSGLRKPARQLGFTGRIAIHPDQVVPINAAYSPTEEEVAFARRVVDAFAASPGIGVIGLDGKMLDMPHLKQANRLLAMAELMAQRAKPS